MSNESSALERASRFAKDFRENWFVYTVLAAIIAVTEWTVIEKIHSMSFEYVRDERDGFARQNQALQQQLSRLNEKEAENQALRARVATLTGELERARPAGSTPEGPRTPSDRKSIPTTPRGNPAPMSVNTGGIPVKVDAANSTANSQSRPQGIQCAVASANLKALADLLWTYGQRASVIPLPLSESEQGAARLHLRALSTALGGDETMQKMAEEISVSQDAQILHRSLAYSKSIVASQCPERMETSAPAKATDRTRESCASAERLQQTLRQLAEEVDSETILTPKDHLVGSFNRILAEAKKEFENDHLVVSLHEAQTYYWHAETKKYLIHDISILRGRLDYIASVCGKGPSSTNSLAQ